MIIGWLAVFLIIWIIISLMQSVENLSIKQKEQLHEVDSLMSFVSLLEDRINELKIERDQLTFEVLSKEIRNNPRSSDSLFGQFGRNLYLEKVIENENEDLIEFLNGISNHEKFEVNIQDWQLVIDNIIYNTYGTRRSAILLSLTLASVDIKFKLGGVSPDQGFDSSNFIKYVLNKVGIDITLYQGKKLSESIMENLSATDSPVPGDLIFYGGDIGNFCLIYLGKSASTGKNIAVGVLDSSTPYVIIDTDNLNPVFENQFIGYFRVPYEN